MKKTTHFLISAPSFLLEIFDAIFVAKAVLPIEGLPAIITKSDLCNPPIFLSKSLKPVFKPTTSSLFLNAFSAISKVCA